MIETLRLQSVLDGWARWSVRHRRIVSGSVLALLTGFGAAAFGVAPLAPDASDLPKRLVIEALQTPPVAGQLESLAAHTLQLARSEVTRPNDSADSLLRRLGVQDVEAARWMQADPVAGRLWRGRSGKMISAQVRNGRLLSLVARYPTEESVPGDAGPGYFQRLSLEHRDDLGWQASHELAPLQSTVRLASGTIRTSLFDATDAAGIPDAVAVQLAETFATDIDFHRALRKGDHFSVVFEALSADGEPVVWNGGSGRVLAAEFVNNGRSYQAVWFGAGKGGYFDFDGNSKRKVFLSSPLEFSRVTSGFGMRIHPVLGGRRAHVGVDYGAPTGTPVRSVGEGVVEFAGVQNGYGNVIKIRHAGERLTVYGHLSRINVRKGQSVTQGALIGAVGATGRATGPHLHFEFQVRGEHQDPRQVALASEAYQLDGSQRPQFQQTALLLRERLELAEVLQGLPGRVD